MPNNEENPLKTLLRLITQRRWLAAIMLGSGLATSFFFTEAKDFPYASYLVYGCAVMFLAAAVTFVVKRLTGPYLGPGGIQGPSPFINDKRDAELFRKLGRSAEIASLRRDAVNDQIRLIVVTGEAGCGKTSVLRSGLQWEVRKEDNIEVCYWSASPEATIDQLTAAVNSTSTGFKKTWQSFLTASASDLPVADDNKIRILIIDQFDVLRRDYGQHNVFFDLLERVCNGPAPPRFKWVIAFRNDYWSVWQAIRQRLGATAALADVPLASLDIKVAEIALSRVLAQAGVEASSGALKRFLSRVAEGASLRSVWIGVGSEVFSRWARLSRWRFVSKRRYLRCGGAKGVIAEHLEFHLQAVAPTQYGILINAMCRGLIDGNTRVKTGARVRDLAQEDRISADELDSYFRALAGEKRRVVERVESYPNEERYRLSQEQFTEILLLLNGQTVSEEIRLGWSFNEQFECRKQSGQLRYLLSGKQLRQALRSQKYLVKEPGKTARKRFLTQSLWWYRFTRAVVLLLCIVAVVAAYSGYKYVMAKHYGGILHGWHLPPDLYTKQEQLESLHIQSAGIEHVQWLKSKKLTELEINSSALTSLQGISNAPHLHTLSLSITYAPIRDLSPLGRLRELTDLTLFIGGSRLTNLNGLSALERLHSLRLSLDNTNIDISAIRNLPHLTDVKLELQTTTGPNLAAITQFSKAEDFSVNLRDSSIRQLPQFPRMDHLTTLTLNLENSSIVQLNAIGSLHALKSLTINLRNAPNINSLPDLSGLTDLERLDLNLEGSTVIALPLGFNHLPNLKTLSLRLARTAVKQIPDLRDLPNLENLTLDLNSQIRGLPQLAVKRADPNAGAQESKRGLKSLTLKVRSWSDSDLNRLRELSFLNRLDLDITASPVSALPPLTGISELHDLTIHVNWPQLKHAPELPQLNQLTLYVQDALPVDVSPAAAPSLLEPLVQTPSLNALTLYLDDPLTNLPSFGETSQLTAFVLHMKRARMNALNHLEELKQLTGLTLDLEDSSSLESLSGVGAMTHLQDLWLNLSGTSIQDMSALNKMTELCHLDLAVGSKVTTLPYLNSRDIQSISLDMEAASNLSLAELGKLVPLKELTINRSIGSLSGLPTAATELNFGPPLTRPQNSQAGCTQQQSPVP
jgi:hypothetical protein